MPPLAIRAQTDRSVPWTWRPSFASGPSGDSAPWGFGDLNRALEGRYTIDGVVGSGGMATVYRARDLRHGRHVAIKVLHPDLCATLAAERFLREIQIVAGLNHPHILPLFDSGTIDDCLFYVMPLVEGGSLRQRLDDEAPVRLADAIRIAGEVAGALDYAHRQNIVHRDIKPENILLADGHAVVADFGIARAISAAGHRPVTQAHLALGTLQYMSPEQASGGPVDGRTDVFGLACVIYELLVGEPPDTNFEVAATPRTLIQNAPPDHRARLRALPDYTKRALVRALTRLPDHRFATAPRFATALASPGGRWRRWTSVRGGVGAALGLLLISSAAAELGVTSPIGLPATRTRVGVTPFETLGQPVSAELGRVFTEEVTIGLARVFGVDVVSLDSDDGRRRGRQLDYLLGGTVSNQALDGRIRIRVRPHLIRASDGVLLWGDAYTEDLPDDLDVPGAIAQRVTLAVEQWLATHGSRDPLSRPSVGRGE